MKYPISCRFCRFSSLSAGDRQQQPASVRLNFFVTCCFPRLLLLLPASVQKSPGKVLSSCLCCFDHQEQSVRGVTLTDWTDISTTEVVPGTFIPRAFIPILFPVTLRGQSIQRQNQRLQFLLPTNILRVLVHSLGYWFAEGPSGTLVLQRSFMFKPQ